MKQTIKCVYCGKPATCWNGHVMKKKSGEKVIAGWCKRHGETPGGFRGRYMKDMGEEDHTIHL